MELPGGTVTLLFTDVEDSTTLVQRLEDAWPPVLDAHRRLIRAAVEDAGGREVDCRADEVFAAFESADAAAGAALSAQRALAAAAWPDAVELRVRMGLHTGRPAVAESSYVGLDVHRAHRISSAGHGGQVLLSAATRDALARAGLEMRPLGEHRLRGLPRPEPIFQLVAPGLRDDFPPLRGVERAVPTTRLRVALADDSVLLREGIARLLGEAGFEVVAQAGTAEDLLRDVETHAPDIAIVDIRMPPTQTDEGLRAAHAIREHHPRTAVLVLSQYVETAYALRLVGEHAGGIGYLLKDRVSDVDEFAEAVRRVAAGGTALDPTVISQLVERPRVDDPLAVLTPRERDVLTLVAEGMSNEAIAQQTGLAREDVDEHVATTFSKLRLPASAEDHRRLVVALALLRT